MDYFSPKIGELEKVILFQVKIITEQAQDELFAKIKDSCQINKLKAQKYFRYFGHTSLPQGDRLI